MATKDPYLPTDTSQHQRAVKQQPKSGKYQVTTLLTYPQNHKNYPKCVCCKKDHNIYKCQEFKAKLASEKLKFVKANNLCFNCLQAHNVKDCPSNNSCFSKDCSKKHHTSLHDAFHRKELKEVNTNEGCYKATVN